jgi:predicted dinucleotide-binding enzyme
MFQRRALLAFLAAAGGLGLTSRSKPNRAMANGEKPDIAMIGTGEIGGALGKRWADLGYKIIYGSRTPDAERVQSLIREVGNGAEAYSNSEAAAKTSLVFLALPWHATEEVVKSLGNLDGKILMDPINGLKVTDGRFEAPPGLATSSSEMIQSWAPGAHVVKSFNTLSREIMEDPTITGPVTVSLAGESAEAKARVANIVEDMNLVPLDVGALYLARYLEGMARMRIAFRAKFRPEAIEFHLQTHSA